MEEIVRSRVSELLEKKIRLVLQQSESLMYRQVSINRMTVGAPEVQERPGEFVFVNEQVGALKRLFAISPPADQCGFAATVLAMLDEDNAAVVAHTIVELGETRKLGRLSGFDTGYAALWTALEAKLRTEPWLFSDADLAGLREGLAATRRAAEPWLDRRGNVVLQLRCDAAREMLATAIPAVLRVIERVEYLRLLNDLRGIKNPVVETDRRVLMSGLWELGFSRTVAQSRQLVERRAALAAYGSPQGGSDRALPPLANLPDAHEQSVD